MQLLNFEGDGGDLADAYDADMLRCKTTRRGVRVPNLAIW